MPDLISVAFVLLFLSLFAWVLMPKGKGSSSAKPNALDNYLIGDILDKEGKRIKTLTPGGRAELAKRITKLGD